MPGNVSSNNKSDYLLLIEELFNELRPDFYNQGGETLSTTSASKQISVIAKKNFEKFEKIKDDSEENLDLFKKVKEDCAEKDKTNQDKKTGITNLEFDEGTIRNVHGDYEKYNKNKNSSVSLRNVATVTRIALALGYMGWNGYLLGRKKIPNCESLNKYKQKRAPSKKIYNKEYRVWGVIALVLTIVITGYFIGNSHKNDDIIPFFSIDNEEFTILVLPFNSYETSGVDIGGIIATRLRDLNKIDSLEYIIEYWDREINSEFNDDSVRYWKNFHQANLIIYGNYIWNPKEHKDSIVDGTIQLRYIGDNDVLPQELYQNVTSDHLPFTLYGLTEGEVQGDLDCIIYFFSAYMQCQKGHYNAGIGMFSKITNLCDPRIVNVSLNHLGSAYFRLEDYEKAEEYLLKYMEHSSCAITYSNLGAIQVMQKRYGDAILSCEKAIQIDSIYINAWHNKGVANYKLENYIEAKECFDRSVEIQPDCFDTWFYKGILNNTQGNFEEAIKSYNKSIDIKPHFYPAWVNKGIVNINSGQYKEAINNLKKATILNPKDPRAWYNRGLAHLKLREFEQAIECFKKAIDNKSDYYDALLSMGVSLDSLGNHQEANEFYEQAQKLDSVKIDTIQKKEQFEDKSNSSSLIENDNSPLPITENPIITEIKSVQNKIVSDTLIYKFYSTQDGIIQYGGSCGIGSPKHAKKGINTITYILAPNCAYSHCQIRVVNRFRKGSNILDLGEFRTLNTRQNNEHVDKKKNSSIKGIISIDSLGSQECKEDYKEWYKKGLDRIKKKEFKEAITCFNKAIDQAPDSYIDWVDKGEIYYELKIYKKAINCYDEAIKINSLDYCAWYCKGLAYCEFDNSWWEAVNCFSKAIEIKPDFYEAWFFKGWASINARKLYTEAIDCFDRVLKDDPKDTKSWIFKGLAYEGLAYYHAAAIEVLREIYPQEFYFYGHQAFSRYEPRLKKLPNYEKMIRNEQEANHEESIRCYKKAIELNPDCYEAYHRIGYTYYIRFKFNEAIYYFNKAIDIKPDYHQAWFDKGWVYYDEYAGELKNRDEAIRCFKEVCKDDKFALSNKDNIVIGPYKRSDYCILDPDWGTYSPHQKRIKFEFRGKTFETLKWGSIHIVDKPQKRSIEHHRVSIESFWKNFKEDFMHLKQYGIGKDDYMKLIDEIGK